MTQIPTSSREMQIEGVRVFNRFYTKLIGLLDEGLLKSEFSLTEVRVLYELAQRDGLTASQLGRELSINAGYMSRLLKKFEQSGMIARTVSKADARRAVLSLTRVGRKAFRPLDQASRTHVSGLLEPLQPGQRDSLLNAMDSIRKLLGDVEMNSVEPYLLRPHGPGDIGWITHRQGVLYNREYGWDETFEALVARICADFIESFKPGREYSWIAERDRKIVGSIFVCEKSQETALLRLLYVEPETRGLGVGSRLVEECVRFARNKNYKTLMLWTFDVLSSARRIYEANNFKLVAEEEHHSFGKDLIGQNWELAL